MNILRKTSTAVMGLSNKSLLCSAPYSNEQKPYTISSSFPLRQATGFFKTGKIYYQANGVLNGDTTRQGLNYVLATPVVR